ncbi:hypothetical protein RCL1_005346 [Eukaryota sp. TZLM3-RCL]
MSPSPAESLLELSRQPSKCNPRFLRKLLADHPLESFSDLHTLLFSSNISSSQVYIALFNFLSIHTNVDTKFIFPFVLSLSESPIAPCDAVSFSRLCNIFFKNSSFSDYSTTNFLPSSFSTILYALAHVCRFGSFKQDSLEFVINREAHIAAFSAILTFDSIFNSENDNFYSKYSTFLLEELTNFSTVSQDFFEIPSLISQSFSLSNLIVSVLRPDIKLIVLQPLISSIPIDLFSNSLWTIVDRVVTCHVDQSQSNMIGSSVGFSVSSTLFSCFSRLCPDFEVCSSEILDKIIQHFLLIWTCSTETIVSSVWSKCLTPLINFLGQKGSIETINHFYSQVCQLSTSNQNRYLALAVFLETIPLKILSQISGFSLVSHLNIVLKASRDPNVSQILDQFFTPMLDILLTTNQINSDWMTFYFDLLFQSSLTIEVSRVSLFFDSAISSLILLVINNNLISLLIDELNIRINNFKSLSCDSGFNNYLLLIFSAFTSLIKSKVKNQKVVDCVDTNHLFSFLSQILLKIFTDYQVKSKALSLCVVLLTSTYFNKDTKLQSNLIDLVLKSLYILLGSDGYGDTSLVSFMKAHISKFLRTCKRHSDVSKFLSELFKIFSEILVPCSPHNRKLSTLNFLLSTMEEFPCTFEGQSFLIGSQVVSRSILKSIIFDCLCNSWDPTRDVSVKILSKIFTAIPSSVSENFDQIFNSFDCDVSTFINLTSSSLCSESLTRVVSGAALSKFLLLIEEKGSTVDFLVNHDLECPINCIIRQSESSFDCLSSIVGLIKNELILFKNLEIENAGKIALVIRGLVAVLLVNFHEFSIKSHDISELLLICVDVCTTFSEFLTICSDSDHELGDFTCFRISDFLVHRIAPDICRRCIQIFEIFVKNYNSIISAQNFQSNLIVSMCFNMLRSIKHVGVIQDSYSLLYSSSKLIKDHYLIDLQSHLIEDIFNDLVSHRRRSGGMPFIFPALLNSTIVSHNSSSEQIIKNLIKNLVNPSSSVKIISNILNIFSTLIADLNCCNFISKFLDLISSHVIAFLNHDSWDVRSAASRCLSVLSHRLFGAKKVKSSSNSADFEIFTMNFSSTFKSIINCLSNISNNSSENELSQSLGCLCLLQRLTTSNIYSENFKTISEILAKLLAFSDGYIRFAAAKTQSFLIDSSNIIQILRQNIDQLSNESCTTNFCSGILWTNIHLLERSRHEQLEIKESLLHSIELISLKYSRSNCYILRYQSSLISAFLQGKNIDLVDPINFDCNQSEMIDRERCPITLKLSEIKSTLSDSTQAINHIFDLLMMLSDFCRDPDPNLINFIILNTVSVFPDLSSFDLTFPYGFFRNITNHFVNQIDWSVIDDEFLLNLFLNSMSKLFETNVINIDKSNSIILIESMEVNEATFDPLLLISSLLKFVSRYFSMKIPNICSSFISQIHNSICSLQDPLYSHSHPLVFSLLCGLLGVYKILRGNFGGHEKDSRLVYCCSLVENILG